MNTADYTNREDQPQPGTEQPPVSKLIEQTNIADNLETEQLEKMGQEVYDGYHRDLQSKEAWDHRIDDYVALAAQIVDAKSWPWPKASNVKYPLLAISAMQFAARAYPSLIPADGKVVQFRVNGADQQGMKAAKADKLAKHMNYQLLEDMCDWEEEVDRLLIQLPVVGCLFKKTYFDPIKKQNISRLVGPKSLVVNYWASSLEGAHRKTEIIPMTKNQVVSMQNAGLYRDVELPDPRSMPEVPSKNDVHGNQPPSSKDDTTPYVILEQHTYWDLDDDGYQEPYIITIEEQSKQVLRVVARFDSDGVKTNAKGKVICIEPVEYYTKYGFVPNPDGGFYDIGFGHLLGPINESVNTIVNQLIDAGTLSNLQAGFIGKGLRLKLGKVEFQPGEWKAVNAVGDDIRKQVFPLPTKEPSEVLFKLLGLLIESGKELASVAEIFTGKMPGQNTPATTTQASIEQGMKVFTAIYKRTYRSLTKEFKKIFRLNSLYDENFEKAQMVLDEPITREDYDPKTYDVCPTADPTAVSTTQKALKAEMLMQVVPLGLNMDEVKRRLLEAQEQPNIEALLMDQQGQPIQPPPDPKMAQMQAQTQMKQEEHQMKMVTEQMKLQFKQQEAMMDQKFMQMEKMMEMRMKEMEFRQKAEHQQKQSVLDAQTGAMEMQQMTQEHQQKSQMSDEKHQMGIKQIKDKANAQRDASRVQGLAAKSGNSRSNAGSKGSDRGSKK